MASKAAPRPLLARLLARPFVRHPAPSPPRRPRPAPSPPPVAAAPCPGVRFAHAIPRPPPPSAVRLKPQDEAQALVSGQPPASEGPRPARRSAYYQLSFTCVPCGHRSHHNVSKQGYHTGSVLITCPGCRDRHVISDHLDIFGDRTVTVEDLMRERGRLVKRGSLGEDGDVEFWPDDSEPLPGDATETRDS